MYIKDDYIAVPRARYEELLETETRVKVLVKVRLKENLIYNYDVLEFLGYSEEAEAEREAERIKERERREKYANME